STIAIEIADDDSTRTRGLMQRPSMDDGTGMVFIFPTSDYQSFWMANTQMSLDMMFVNSDSTIVEIHKYTRPLSAENIGGSRLSRFVVEVPAGYTDTQGIVEGDRIRWWLEPERIPASARALCHGVGEMEPLPFESVAEVELGTFHVQPAFEVHDHVNAGDFGSFVGFSDGGIPAEVVGQTGTAPGFDGHAQVGAAKIDAFGAGDVEQACCCPFGYRNVHSAVRTIVHSCMFLGSILASQSVE